MMEMEAIVTWLIQQAPVVAVLGAVVWWLSKRLVKAEEQKDKMAEDVIKLTTLWQSKGEELGDGGVEKHREILRVLNEIRILVQK